MGVVSPRNVSGPPVVVGLPQNCKRYEPAEPSFLTCSVTVWSPEPWTSLPSTTTTPAPPESGGGWFPPPSVPSGALLSLPQAASRATRVSAAIVRLVTCTSIPLGQRLPRVHRRHSGDQK